MSRNVGAPPPPLGVGHAFWELTRSEGHMVETDEYRPTLHLNSIPPRSTPPHCKKAKIQLAKTCLKYIILVPHGVKITFQADPQGMTMSSACGCCNDSCCWLYMCANLLLYYEGIFSFEDWCETRPRWPGSRVNSPLNALKR